MPEIARFYGIVITLNFNDHLPPHFHVAYGEWRAIADIASGAILEGQLPRNAARMVREWAAQHVAELREDWELARTGTPPFSIAPLE